MTSVTTTLLGIIALLPLAALAAGLLTVLCYPVFERSVEHCAAAPRSLLLLFTALLPVFTAFLVTLLVFMPAWSELLIPAHCHQGDCSFHLPAFTPTSLGGGLLTALTLLGTIAAAVFAYRRVRRGRQRLTTLRALSRRPEEGDYQLVEHPQLLAWCAGLWQPRVFISHGLVDLLGDDELAVVLAHERGHLRRRDNLRLLILHWCTLLWPQGVRVRIREAVSHASEVACDQLALRETGNPALLRSAILRLANRPLGGSSREIASREAPLRLAALAADETALSAPWPAVAMLVAQLLLFSALLTGIAHTAMEWIARAPVT